MGMIIGGENIGKKLTKEEKAILGEQVKIKEQKEFPLMLEYMKEFDITKDTIFALGDSIYTNNKLTQDLYVHELQHLYQQMSIGVSEWVYDYLHSIERRLLYELDAYQVQLASIKDKNIRNLVRIQSAKNLSSGLYGNIITYEDAFKRLKV